MTGKRDECVLKLFCLQNVLKMFFPAISFTGSEIPLLSILEISEK